MAAVLTLGLTTMQVPVNALAEGSLDQQAEANVSSSCNDDSLKGDNAISEGIASDSAPSSTVSCEASGATADIVIGGVQKTSDDDTSATLTVNGDVRNDDRAIDVRATYGGTADVTVNGNVSGGLIGVCTYSTEPDSSVNVAVNGNVTSKYDFGVRELTTYGGTSSVSVKGDVEGAVGAYARTVGSVESYLFVGDVDDFDNTYEIGGIRTGGAITLVIDGNLTGTSQAGLELDKSEKSGSIDVLVSGTISGNASNGYAGVVLDNATVANSTSLTAWRITSSDDGAVAKLVESGDPAKAFEAAINYIIKVVQPGSGAILTATNAQGGALAQSHGYGVAREGERVLLKVDLKPGYVLAGAYGDEGQTIPLAQDTDGNWYIEVPKGGGVMLSAIVKSLSDTEPTPSEVETPATEAKTESSEAKAPTNDAKAISNEVVATKALPATGDKTYTHAMGLAAYASLAAFAGSVALRRKDAAHSGKHFAR